MTRGRYAAKASKKRAESAEEQLDRLLPQLVDAKRTAARYKSEAEQVPALRRQLTELKDRRGVPHEQHLAALAELDLKHEEQLAEIETATIDVIEHLRSKGMIRSLPGDNEWISSHFMATLRKMQRPVALALLGAIGLERELARGMLEHTLAKKARADAMPDALNMQRYAREVLGRTDGMIPASLMEQRIGSIDEILHPDEDDETDE